MMEQVFGVPDAIMTISYEKWESSGKENVMARANKKHKEILE